MNKKITSIVTLALTLPVAALAFNPGAVPGSNAGLNILGLVDIIFSILWPVAVAFFIIQFVRAGMDYFGGKHEEVNNKLIWGAVGVAVALLAFSIPFIIRNQIGV